MDVQKTGRLIAQARKERELTQRELAERLHVSDRAVSKWERGLNLPEAALFEPLCQILGITVTELLRGERAEVSVPVLEQAVDEAVALAGAGEEAVLAGDSGPAGSAGRRRCTDWEAYVGGLSEAALLRPGQCGAQCVDCLLRRPNEW